MGRSSVRQSVWSAAVTASGLFVVALLTPLAGLHQSVAQAQTAAEGVALSSGVYSKAQAQRGLVEYARACEHCHGANLTGDATAEVPSLVADAFIFHWRGRTLQALYDRLRMAMPADAPGTLGESRYVDVIAYLLEANGFPPGQVDLDRGRLSAIVVERTP